MSTNNVIWKYVMEGIATTFDVPEGGEVLAAQIQNGALCIWMRVNPSAEKKPRYFVVFGTGHIMNLDREYNYITTFQAHNGMLVFHLFEDVTCLQSSP